MHDNWAAIKVTACIAQRPCYHDNWAAIKVTSCIAPWPCYVCQLGSD